MPGAKAAASCDHLTIDFSRALIRVRQEKPQATSSLKTRRRLARVARGRSLRLAPRAHREMFPDDKDQRGLNHEQSFFPRNRRPGPHRTRE